MQGSRGPKRFNLFLPDAREKLRVETEKRIVLVRVYFTG